MFCCLEHFLVSYFTFLRRCWDIFRSMTNAAWDCDGQIREANYFYPKVKLNNAIYLILDSWIGHYNVQRGFTSLKVRKGSQRSSSNFGKFWDSVKGLILFIQGNIFRAQIKFLFSDRKTDTTPSWRDLAHATTPATGDCAANINVHNKINVHFN